MRNVEIVVHLECHVSTKHCIIVTYGILEMTPLVLPRLMLCALWGYVMLPQSSALCYYSCMFFASILRVAWGTARNRSLLISFPVMRQIP